MQYTKGIKDLLAADGMVTARVGTKIYPIEAPSGTAMPFVTLNTPALRYTTLKKARRTNKPE